MSCLDLLRKKIDFQKGDTCLGKMHTCVLANLAAGGYSVDAKEGHRLQMLGSEPSSSVSSDPVECSSMRQQALVECP